MSELDLLEQKAWEADFASHDSLKAARNYYLRENLNDEWRRMAKKGTLDEDLELKALRCAELARTLIAQGWFYREAWYHAKAVEILDSPNLD